MGVLIAAAMPSPAWTNLPRRAGADAYTRAYFHIGGAVRLRRAVRPLTQRVLMTHLTEEWHKSTYSNDTFSACVEVRRTAGGVGVRDSKDLAVPALAVTGRSWSFFLDGIRHMRN
jgi:uncharacterized protein DUF397